MFNSISVFKPPAISSLYYCNFWFSRLSLCQQSPFKRLPNTGHIALVLLKSWLSHYPPVQQQLQDVRSFLLIQCCRYPNILHILSLINIFQIHDRILVRPSMSSGGEPASPGTPPESPQSQGPWETQLWDIPEIQQLVSLSWDWEFPIHKTFKNWKRIHLGMAHPSHLCVLPLLVRAQVLTLIYCVRPGSYTVGVEVISCSFLTDISASDFACLP